MADQVYWDDVTEGMELPEVVKNPTTQQLVKYAGASGDTKAVIIALELPSARFQIAKYPGIAPASARRESDSSASGPQIAYVRSRSIHVAPYAGRFARYNKGVPYDG